MVKNGDGTLFCNVNRKTFYCFVITGLIGTGENSRGNNIVKTVALCARCFCAVGCFKSMADSKLTSKKT